MPRSIIDRLFESSHSLSRDELRKLRSSSFERLRKQILGKQESPSRPRAMEILARADPARSVAPLKRVLLDERETTDLRAAASSALTLAGTRAAESALITAAGSEADERLAMHAAYGLAKVGTKRALPVLEEGLRTGSSRARAARTFAASVIAAREDRPVFRIQPHAGKLPPFSRRKRTPGTVGRLRRGFERVLEELGPEAYGLELTPKLGFRFLCGERRSALLFNPAVFDPERFDERLRRPALLGIQLTEVPTGSSYSTSRLLFGWPNPAGGLHLAMTRTDGVRTDAGTYTGDATEGRILLRSIRPKKDVVTEVRGTVKHGRVVELEVTNAVSESLRAVPRAVTPRVDGPPA